jgi:hypothetical protein
MGELLCVQSSFLSDKWRETDVMCSFMTTHTLIIQHRNSLDRAGGFRRKVLGSNLDRDTGYILTELFCDFPCFRQANDVGYTSITAKTLPSQSFRISHLSVILPF